MDNVSRREFMGFSVGVAAGSCLGGETSSGAEGAGKVREFTVDEWFSWVIHDDGVNRHTSDRDYIRSLEVGEKIRVSGFDDVDLLRDVASDIYWSTDSALRERCYMRVINEANLTLEVVRQR